MGDNCSKAERALNLEANSGDEANSDASWLCNLKQISEHF